MHARASRWALAALALAGCASASAKRTAQAPAPAAPAAPAADTAMNPFPSTYKPLPSQPTLIRNATVLTATGPVLQGASVLMQDGKIAAVGANLSAPAGAVVVDGTGKWVTPGIIDTHSHIGGGASIEGAQLDDINEATNPVTAQVWVEHGVWPQDPQFWLALAGGVTTEQILPGSANLIGGRSVVLKNVPARTVQGMKFPGAPYGLKMACGENPKRVYGQRGGPSTRMGNVAGYRAAWIRAQKYRDDWDNWRKNGADASKRPQRDLQLETLAEVLRGNILVQNHCYRADEMANMIDISKEFGYHIASFHHAVEAYKIRDLLAKDGICASMWSDWWGFKMEAYDGIRQNIALMDEAGACTILHTDDAKGIQRLNQDAAKAMEAGWEAGIQITPERAIKWITINPARALGIDKQTGSLETGKMADVVLWTGNPFSVYAKAEKVFIDGALVYDRDDAKRQPTSDFTLGNDPQEVIP
ncbi:MAG TPA: amidohydrolase [Longimicrobiales bacterium]|nr:amidohydrolase [Longimicrobiales bacterium]